MKDALKLLEKYRNGEASEKEKELLERWVHELNNNEPVYLPEEEHEEIRMKGRQVMKSILEKNPAIKLWVKVSIAASIALAVFLGHYIYQTGKKSADQSIVSADINPGKVAATLTLSNGKKIYIADVKGRNVAEESGVKITKNENGELVYTIIDNKQESGKMQTLTTYRGETQVLVLPDGSKVWLNAASSIKYPSSFAAASKRRVELAGEAYFEIAKDKSHPFIVATDKQEVEVLGTHFNINSYHDETMVKTTLLEGSIQVSTLGGQAKVLKPGEQSTLSGANLIRISEVDVDDVVAWKNGFFVFEDESVEDVMKQLARWYNVEVKYNSDDLKHKKFSGSISRYYKVSQVLDKLAKIGLVGFKLENRTIFVENKSK